MRKSSGILISLLSTLLALSGCDKETEKNTQEDQSYSQVSSVESSSISETSSDVDEPKYDGTINLNNGFENEDGKYLIDCLTGTNKAINEDTSKVLTGTKSMKISVSEYADASFKFSSDATPSNISEYEYISFWIYVDHDGEFGLTNSCLKNSTTKQYINSSIQGKEWTKIVVDKNSDVFSIIKYNIGFNNFIISGTGDNYGKVLNYNFYIDDVRIYKEGMAGECTMVFDMGDNTFNTKLSNIEAGNEITLPNIRVYSPQGYSIYGANDNVNRKIIAPNGNEVSIVDNKVTFNQIGTYSFIASYQYDGIENVFSSSFDVVLGNIVSPRMGIAYVSEAYTIPNISINKLDNSGEVTTTITKKVYDESNNEVAVVDDSFTPTSTGVYKVNYTITKNINNVENSLVVTKDISVNDTHGIVSDYSSLNTNIFKVNTQSVIGKIVSNEEYKNNKNGNTNSYRLTVANEGGISLSFNDNFPYDSIDGYKYLSFWVYSEATSALTLETSFSSKKITLDPQTWSLASFTNEEVSEDIGNGEIIIYDSIAKTKINCNFYIDDVRLIKTGDAEEVFFAKNVTTEDYNSSTKQGRLFSANYKYEIDRTLYDMSGNAILEQATITSIKDKRNKDVKVEDGKYFTPITVGKHTITLSYEKDGIISSCKKIIDVTEQMLLTPFDKYMLIPGEQNVEYSFTNLPELWNYGVVDTTTNIEVLVYDPSGNEVSITNNKFTPNAYGKYSVFFLAKDATIKSSSALYETSLLVFQNGKYGVVCDFEDKDVSYMESTTYYYGEVGDFFLSNEKAHSGEYSARFNNLSDETKEMKFSLNEKNPVGDISNTKYVSFWIYIDDAAGGDYLLGKTAYAGWINETDSSYQVGSLRVTIKSNEWTEIRIEREDYEKVLGGTIFAGQTVGVGGSYWAAANNDYITTFAITAPGYVQISKNVKIYIDDFTLGY